MKSRRLDLELLRMRDKGLLSLRNLNKLNITMVGVSDDAVADAHPDVLDDIAKEVERHQATVIPVKSQIEATVKAD